MIGAIPKLIGAAISTYGTVKDAIAAQSDGGKKITKAEWSAILGIAFKELGDALTVIFADKLEPGAAKLLLD